MNEGSKANEEIIPISKSRDYYFSQKKMNGEPKKTTNQHASLQKDFINRLLPELTLRIGDYLNEIDIGRLRNASQRFYTLLNCEINLERLKPLLNDEAMLAFFKTYKNTFLRSEVQSCINNYQQQKILEIQAADEERKILEAADERERQDTAKAKQALIDLNSKGSCSCVSMSCFTCLSETIGFITLVSYASNARPIEPTAPAFIAGIVLMAAPLSICLLAGISYIFCNALKICIGKIYSLTKDYQADRLHTEHLNQSRFFNIPNNNRSHYESGDLTEVTVDTPLLLLNQ